jgi:hypothetical protein
LKSCETTTTGVLSGFRLFVLVKQRTFGYCPFGGIICLACNEAIPAEGKNKVANNMGKHVAAKFHLPNCDDQAVTAPERRAFVALANKKLLPVACDSCHGVG